MGSPRNNPYERKEHREPLRSERVPAAFRVRVNSYSPSDETIARAMGLAYGEVGVAGKRDDYHSCEMGSTGDRSVFLDPGICFLQRLERREAKEARQKVVTEHEARYGDGGRAMEGLTEGRMVHYVMPEGRSANEHRAATVVKVWRNADGTPPATGYCNLQVHRDGSNDGVTSADITGAALNEWRTSVQYSEQPKPGTWHWIERA